MQDAGNSVTEGSDGQKKAIAKEIGIGIGMEIHLIKLNAAVILYVDPVRPRPRPPPPPLSHPLHTLVALSKIFLRFPNGNRR